MSSGAEVQDFEAAADPLPGRPVLLVEDDDVIGPLLEASLVARGIEVVRAATGAEAYRLVEEDGPAVMIIDVNIALPNGIEILRHLQFPIKKGLVQVLGLIMPGEADLEDRCRELGVRSFLKEPFDLDELGTSVDRLLQETAS